MSELRRDYALDRWVIIAEKRGLRPHQFKKVEPPKDAVDYFAVGNEHLTPPEIGRVENKGSWLLRWFNNKFPAVSTKEKFHLKKGLFVSTPAYGHHEVIVETPAGKQLWNLSPKEIHQVLKVYQLRIKTLQKQAHIAYVSVFKNHGKAGGTSLLHSHSQIITTPFTPPYLKQKATAYKPKVCDKIIKEEKNSKRTIKETANFLAWAPYASRFNFESWIYPKRQVKTMMELSDDELMELAIILKGILKNMQKVCDSYNILTYSSPNGVNMRFHMEIVPRVATWAGFELASGIIINAVSPETAASWLKK
tara:strand:+ start:11019 stop:11939 length:921 start_codon:yes stop_codon:yes gene_type:complete